MKHKTRLKINKKKKLSRTLYTLTKKKAKFNLNSLLKIYWAMMIILCISSFRHNQSSNLHKYQMSWINSLSKEINKQLKRLITSTTRQNPSIKKQLDLFSTFKRYLKQNNINKLQHNWSQNQIIMFIGIDWIWLINNNYIYYNFFIYYFV